MPTGSESAGICLLGPEIRPLDGLVTRQVAILTASVVGNASARLTTISHRSRATRLRFAFWS
ncbi:MAG: hypothetical protein EAZ42_12215 [Verrucomicrobia bacterium]|nr:MAG: hypothetical protein EAZ42_12215 [Verrucomicrobiota bacterium]